ncbi:MAG: flagellar basal-body MS-ring/collar protein FliF [Gammaproteobacteria bacterium]|nr:flagellar basal-body MS-ring/collar protein FliF [Gammaproteobacteria bacterium]
MAEATANLTNPLAALDTIPGMRQLLLLVGLALSISIGVTAAFWLRAPTYSLLYSNISDREAGEIVEFLSNSEIPHELDRKSGAVLVAADKLHEARMKLASQGLPRGTGVGMEMMDGDSGFSTSQFMENARYHHAIETELARTIGSLRPVQYARVHLAEPKSTVFLRQKKQPSASVFLSLFPGRHLEESQVRSIVNLVASSVPELESGQVTVVDQQGRLLSSPSDSPEFEREARQFEQTRRLESTYVSRIHELLSPMLGPNRVRATVTADLDFTVREETRELFDPDNAIVRSEEVSENRQTGAGLLSGGIPGALSNQPPTEAAEEQAQGPAENAKTSKAPLNESSKRTRNFEIDRTLSHTQEPTGKITRLSVGVIVDDKRVIDADGETISEPLSTTELEEITNLVKGAVGFDESRGDTVSISNASFYQPPEPEALEEPGFLESMDLRGILKQVLSAALILVVILGAVRPLLRSLSGNWSWSGAAAPVSNALPRSAGGAAAMPAAEQPPPAPLSFDDKVSVARQLAEKNPERVAQIVRSWVQADG